MSTAVLSTPDIEARYGRGYSALLGLLVGELHRGGVTKVRTARRASNARAEGLRVALVTLLHTEHFMCGELAAETVVRHVEAFRGRGSE
ncbi:hypothetical protein [Streptomyces sp. NPDC046939]|uniref:hypothetical protein n=1 Tax=Streptomyces sp. NPDC046939 TaxID=3155376 RepID=UPI0033EEFD9A